MLHVIDTILAIALSAGPVDASTKCGAAEVRTHYFTGEVGIEIRVIDRHRCGVVELRVVDHFDVAGATRTREVYRDRDHDGAFERYSTRVEPLRGHNADLALGRANPMAIAFGRG